MNSGRLFRTIFQFGCAAILCGISVNPLHLQTSAAQTGPAPALPERNPSRNAFRPHPGQVETPEWSAQEVQEATDRCLMILADTGVEYRFLASIREGRCGAPAPIELSSIGKASAVSINPPAQVTCGLAATLSAWADTVLQPSARKYLAGEITGIRTAASYVCRNRYNSSGKPLSEHARANALDLTAFKPGSGDWVKVIDRWTAPSDEGAAQVVSQSSTLMPQAGAVQDAVTASGAPADPHASQQTDIEPAPGPRSAFLHEIHEGACRLFGTVLGPLANEAHKDHFHYDLAKRNHGSYCQ